MMQRKVVFGWWLAVLLVGIPLTGWAEKAAEDTSSEEYCASAQESNKNEECNLSTKCSSKEKSTTGELQVEEAAIATAIQNRMPQGSAETFPIGTPKLYCYSKLIGGNAGDEITQTWRKGKEKSAVVTLKVGGSPWRTFSSKTIGQEDAGAWSVEIRQGDVLLKTLAFEVK